MNTLSPNFSTCGRGDLSTHTILAKINTVPALAAVTWHILQSQPGTLLDYSKNGNTGAHVPGKDICAKAPSEVGNTSWNFMPIG